MPPIAQDGASAKLALIAALTGLGLLHTVMARTPYSAKQEVEAHITGHLKGRHAEAEVRSLPPIR